MLDRRDTWATDPRDKRRVINDGTFKYNYDDEGNLDRKVEIATGKVTQYSWDHRNRLTSVSLSDGTQVQYLYDGEDRRVAKKINGVIKEQYVYDDQDIALVLDAGGTIVDRYFYGDGVDNVLSREKDGAVTWSLGDRQGSIVDLVNEQGDVLNHFVYDGFGNRTATTNVDFRYGYTGRELDAETGLYYYRARYYDPQLGRFISEDPISFSAGDTNLYRYTFNSPTNWTDPQGTNALNDIGEFFYDRLVDTDQLFAGFAHALTFGRSTQYREWAYGDNVAGQHEGTLFNIGQGLGFAAGIALGAAAPNALVGSISWAQRAAQGYTVATTGLGAYDTTTKIMQGQMDWNNPLSYLEIAGSFAPAIVAGTRQLGKIRWVENAISRATAVGENVWSNASRKLSRLNLGADDLSSPNQLGIEYARPPEHFSYTGDPLDFVPGKLQGLANRKMRMEFREEVIKLGLKSDNIIFTKQGGSGFNPGIMAVRINKTTATPGTLVDEFAHVFNKVHGKGTYLSDDLAKIHVELAELVKTLGSTDRLGKNLNTLYHQLELKNLINSGSRLPSFVRAIPKEELEYFLRIATEYEGQTIIPGTR